MFFVELLVMEPSLPSSSSPFPESVFSYLAQSEHCHWWFRSRSAILIWLLRSKVYPFGKFLEVGCGNGYVIQGISKEFPEAELEASDYFDDGLACARQRVPGCSFRKLDATAMDEVAAYDCIGSFDVIEHIQADEVVLANFYRALRPGGYLLLTVPQHPWLWSRADDFAHHVRRYTASELRQKVLKTGLRIIYVSSFVSLLLPLMMTARRVSDQGQHYDPEHEFRIHPVINWVLYRIMMFEFLLLQLGLRFPAGGSLLLLSQKP